MIFCKKMLIQIGNNNIKKEEYFLFKKKRKTGEEIRNRKLHILIYDEEIYIKKFQFPKAKGQLLYNLVKNELSFSVGNVNNILFDYKIINCINSYVEVLVFYINAQKISFINEISSYDNIKTISLIQIVMQKYYKKKIKEKNYIFTFIYEKGLYILGVKDRNIVANMKIENFNCEEENFEAIIEAFQSKYIEQLVNVKNIYMSNICVNEKDKIEFIDLSIKNLVKYEKEKLITYCF